MDNRQIGERLSTLRKARGYKSQEAFAEAIDISERKTISKWETGETAIPINRLATICEVLDCDMDYLFGKIATPKNTTASVMQQTQLSEDAVNLILHTKRKDVLTAILESEHFTKLISIITECSDMEKDKTFAKAIASSVMKRGGLSFAGETQREALEYSEIRMLEMIVKYNPTTLSKQLAKDAAEELFEDVTKRLYEGA